MTHLVETKYVQFSDTFPAPQVFSTDMKKKPRIFKQAKKTADFQTDEIKKKPTGFETITIIKFELMAGAKIIPNIGSIMGTKIWKILKFIFLKSAEVETTLLRS